MFQISINKLKRNEIFFYSFRKCLYKYKGSFKSLKLIYFQSTNRKLSQSQNSVYFSIIKSGFRHKKILYVELMSRDVYVYIRF